MDLITDTGHSTGTTTAVGEHLRRRIEDEAATLTSARLAGDDLQVQISSAEIDDLVALAERQDIQLPD